MQNDSCLWTELRDIENTLCAANDAVKRTKVVRLCAHASSRGLFRCAKVTSAVC